MAIIARIGRLAPSPTAPACRQCADVSAGVAFDALPRWADDLADGGHRFTPHQARRGATSDGRPRWLGLDRDEGPDVGGPMRRMCNPCVAIVPRGAGRTEATRASLSLHLHARRCRGGGSAPHVGQEGQFIPAPAPDGGRAMRNNSAIDRSRGVFAPMIGSAISSMWSLASSRAMSRKSWATS